MFVVVGADPALEAEAKKRLHIDEHARDISRSRAKLHHSIGQIGTLGLESLHMLIKIAMLLLCILVFAFVVRKRLK